jgi:hypothetical protein
LEIDSRNPTPFLHQGGHVQGLPPDTGAEIEDLFP